MFQQLCRNDSRARALTHAWPRAIVHIDGDAFFASCEQVVHPELKGRPVATGSERGIISSASYEARAFGVKRGVPPWEAKKMCPELIFMNSDYRVYSEFSQRMFAVMRRFTPLVEEYSIDEAFADITGFDTLYSCSYPEIVRRMKEAIEKELGITVSAGVSVSKVLAKVGSKWKKPSGCTAIALDEITTFLEKLPVGSLWGVGKKLSERLEGHGVRTALDFAQRGQGFVRTFFAKPQVELWRELHGESVYPVIDAPKDGQASVSKTRTFTPATDDRDFVWAQLLKNLEHACERVRGYRQVASGLSIFLKTAEFRFVGEERKLARRSALPTDMILTLREMFEKIFRQGVLYRATGVTLTGLCFARDECKAERQLSLFDAPGVLEKEEKARRMYNAVDVLVNKMGRHTIYLGSSMSARKGSRDSAQYDQQIGGIDGLSYRIF